MLNYTSQELQDLIITFICDNNYPFTTAREMAEKFDTDSKKASGALRALENANRIKSKKVRCGMSSVNVYYLDK